MIPQNRHYKDGKLFGNVKMLSLPLYGMVVR